MGRNCIVYGWLFFFCAKMHNHLYDIGNIDCIADFFAWSLFGFVLFYPYYSFGVQKI